MAEKLITLWRSEAREAQLRGKAMVTQTVVLNLETNKTLLYTQAGVRPDFGDAQHLYTGPRKNLVLIRVGDTTPTGHVTMAGTPLTPEQAKLVDSFRETNAYQGYGGQQNPRLPIAGTQSPEQLAAARQRSASRPFRSGQSVPARFLRLDLFF